MRSIIVRPRDPALGPALRLALIFAAVKFLLHVVTNLCQAHLGYGYFRDEMYYIVCGRRLAWGYVDHGPLVALQARLSTSLFGMSLAGIRMLSAAAGAGRIFLTGVLAWSLGGGRAAQALAMTAILASPQFLSIDSFLSMNSAESLFWMGALLPLILIVRGGSPRLWLVFGVAAGLGLLNKPSMAFFLFALLGGLLLTPARRLLASRWAVVGTVLLLALALPNLLWQAHHHWPTLEFLLNARHSDKNPRLAPLPFLGLQILYMDPLTALVWVPGLWWLLQASVAGPWRWLGLTYLLFLGGMMALHGNHYYVSPIYPILFAAGGIFWQRRLPSRSTGHLFAFPLLEGAIVLVAIVTLPWAIPVLAPERWLGYMKATHLYDLSINANGRAHNRLPLFFADRFGWPEEVALVARAYQSLSPEERARVSIVCANYGEASAVDVLGRGLPPAISANNNYFLWGPGTATEALLIAVIPQPPEALAKVYRSVQIVGTLDHPYNLPLEHRNVYLLRGKPVPLALHWEEAKDYY